MSWPTFSREQGMSGAQLARACGITQQSMATVLTGLQNKGLIDRRTSAVHTKVLRRCRGVPRR